MTHNGSRAAQLFLNFGHSLDHLFLLIYPTVVLAMAPEFGKTYAEMLPLSLGAFVMFGAASLPAGWLADRWSRRGMMAVFFGAIYHPVGIAMLVSGREKFGRVLGVNGVWGNLGVACAALVAGALAHWISWRAAFILPGVIAIATGAAFLVLVPRDFGTARAGPRSPARVFPKGVLVHVFTVTAIATVCGGLIFNATTVAMPKVFDEKLAGLVTTTLGIGVLVSLVYAFAAMAQLCVGWWIDRHSLKSVFVPVVALQVPLLLLAGASEQVAMLIVALAMMFFVFGQIPINDAMLAAYTDERWRARAFAVRYVVSFVGSASAIPLVAYIHRTTGEFNQLFFLLAGFAAVMLIAAITLPGAERRPASAVA